MVKSGAHVASARLFSTAARAATTNAPAAKQLSSVIIPLKDMAARARWNNSSIIYPVQKVRSASTLALGHQEKQHEEADRSNSTVLVAGQGGGKKDDEENGITSYWGVAPNKITKEDGTEWKWNCFRVRYSFIYS